MHLHSFIPHNQKCTNWCIIQHFILRCNPLHFFCPSFCIYVCMSDMRNINPRGTCLSINPCSKVPPLLLGRDDMSRRRRRSFLECKFLMKRTTTSPPPHPLYLVPLLYNPPPLLPFTPFPPQ